MKEKRFSSLTSKYTGEKHAECYVVKHTKRQGGRKCFYSNMSSHILDHLYKMLSGTVSGGGRALLGLCSRAAR